MHGGTASPPSILGNVVTPMLYERSTVANSQPPYSRQLLPLVPQTLNDLSPGPEIHNFVASLLCPVGLRTDMYTAKAAIEADDEILSRTPVAGRSSNATLDSEISLTFGTRIINFFFIASGRSGSTSRTLGE